MLAEPKGKRGRQEFSGYSDPASPSYQVLPTFTLLIHQACCPIRTLSKYSLDRIEMEQMRRGDGVETPRLKGPDGAKGSPLQCAIRQAVDCMTKSGDCRFEGEMLQAPAMSFDHVALQQAASLASNFSTGTKEHLSALDMLLDGVTAMSNSASNVFCIGLLMSLVHSTAFSLIAIAVWSDQKVSCFHPS